MRLPYDLFTQKAPGIKKKTFNPEKKNKKKKKKKKRIKKFFKKKKKKKKKVSKRVICIGW